MVATSPRKYDIRPPSREVWRVEAQGSHGNLYACVAALILGEGTYTVFRAGRTDLGAMEMSPFVRSGEPEAAIDAWWNAVKAPGMPSDVFRWAEGRDVMKGIADVLETVELVGPRLNIAVNVADDAKKLRAEFLRGIEDA